MLSRLSGWHSSELSAVLAHNVVTLLAVIEFEKQNFKNMYTDDEIKKAGADAGFTTHEVDTLFYQLIENKKHEPQQLLQQCNVSGALAPDELDSAAERYLIPKYFTSMPTIEEEIKEFNELKEAFKAGHLLRQ